MTDSLECSQENPLLPSLFPRSGENTVFRFSSTPDAASGHRQTQAWIIHGVEREAMNAPGTRVCSRCEFILSVSSLFLLSFFFFFDSESFTLSNSRWPRKVSFEKVRQILLLDTKTIATHGSKSLKIFLISRIKSFALRNSRRLWKVYFSRKFDKLTRTSKSLKIRGKLKLRYELINGEDSSVVALVLVVSFVISFLLSSRGTSKQNQVRRYRKLSNDRRRDGKSSLAIRNVTPWQKQLLV